MVQSRVGPTVSVLKKQSSLLETNQRKFDSKIHSKDFDTRFPKTHKKTLFGLPSSPKQKLKINRTSKYNARKITNKKKKETLPPEFVACPQCDRIYANGEMISVHIKQCLLLQEGEALNVMQKNQQEPQQQALQQDNSQSSTFCVHRDKELKSKSANAHFSILPNRRISMDFYSRREEGDFDIHLEDTQPKANGSNIFYESFCCENKKRHSYSNKSQSLSTSFSPKNMPILEIYRQHEKQWISFERISWSNKFKKRVSCPLKFYEVPFPPSALKGFGLVGLKEDSPVEVKRARIRAALMRWHPDKFQQAFGFMIDEKDISLIMSKVKDCSQKLNALKDSLHEDTQLNDSINASA